MFGFDQQENLFLSVSGWDANYIPLTIQRRPFLIGFQEQNINGVVEREPVVHIDMGYQPIMAATTGIIIYVCMHVNRKRGGMCGA